MIIEAASLWRDKRKLLFVIVLFCMQAARAPELLKFGVLKFGAKLEDMRSFFLLEGDERNDTCSN